MIPLLLQRAKKAADCESLPPAGLPVDVDATLLPTDVVEFYSRCGGLELFKGSSYSVEIVRPSDFVLSNPEILPAGWERDVLPDDISNDWFVIGRSGEEQYFSIDLASDRVGRCYDSFWETHASPGESPIVARSFTEFLDSLLKAEGQYWYWLAEGFSSLGDAYDDVG